MTKTTEKKQTKPVQQNHLLVPPHVEPSEADRERALPAYRAYLVNDQRRDEEADKWIETGAAWETRSGSGYNVEVTLNDARHRFHLFQLEAVKAETMKRHGITPTHQACLANDDATSEQPKWIPIGTAAPTRNNNGLRVDLELGGQSGTLFLFRPKPKDAAPSDGPAPQ